MSERLTDNPSLFRLRVRYGKRDRLKYLGHLEVIHTIERIVRRAGLPYAVTQGFSPHMRVGFSSALPVGTSSTCEWYDLFMTEFVGLDEAFERLAVASPADLAPIEAAYIDVRTPALTAQLTRLVVSHRPALRSRGARKRRGGASCDRHAARGPWHRLRARKKEQAIGFGSHARGL